jgi:protocatechuate 3,4-dioxygenase beta subunit
VPPTPEATIGPFYPGAFVAAMPQDLWEVSPLVAHHPQGEPVAVTFTVLDVAGRPVPSVVIEVWQANAHGRYRHAADRSPRPLDPQFDGFARVRTTDDGLVRFQTIKPGPHRVREGDELRRAPHLRLAIFASGIDRLVTQVFFEGEPLNGSDPVLQSIGDPLVRDRLVARRCPEGAHARVTHYALDLVLRGDRETPFFDDWDRLTPSHPIAGRTLPVVVNDRESETRTPARPLYRIPAAARDPFTAWAPPLALRAGEDDLTRLAPGRPQGAGQPVVITGRVLDEDSRPVRRTLIEVWNANTYGRYSHLIDAGRNDAPLDPHFYGFGRLLTDGEGNYCVRTLKPGAYIARRDIGWWRPPHVHFSILGSGLRLVTQMYFPGEPLNEKDYIHMIIPETDRPRVIGRELGLTPGGDAAFYFDIVVRGRFQTPPDVD